MQKGNLLFAQSGGPTAVINASAAGVVAAAQKSKAYGKILCAHFGMDGIMNEDFFDATRMTKKQLKLLSETPASAFGSCRFKLPKKDEDPAVYEKILGIFQKYNVSTFVYNGGNDSMDTCHKVADYFKEIGFDCKVVGVPKTVDNDLAGTHHCPGFGSAAKFVATNMEEIALDTAVYEKGRITICEIMGRDAGWLTASSTVATHRGNGPDLIYLPETPFDTKKFFDQALEVYNKKKRCLVALSEGIRDKKGEYIGAVGTKDSFNHTQLGGVAAYLADCLTQKFGIKTRAIEFSLPTRAAGHIASLADQKDAIQCGKYAVELAVSGKTGVMVTTTRKDGKTLCNSFDLAKIANEVQCVPEKYIVNDGSNVSDEFLDYVLPLIEGEVHHDYRCGIPVYFDSSVLPKA
ncbi:MAG: 6-phosphofructokinase [Corallococcus sp.]|nr:6-phosphofructokinase [Corallococcus sp.]MCM1359307.1 6-phosphofructokinase [Corallococcus sp.]MCM1394882.1 6-phosphofructokinase [Corallococcus sp.]